MFLSLNDTGAVRRSLLVNVGVSSGAVVIVELGSCFLYEVEGSSSSEEIAGVLCRLLSAASIASAISR